MGCWAPDQPDDRNYGKETAETLQAQIDAAPKLYANEQQYQPLYAGLTLQNLNTLLKGTPGGTQTWTERTPVEQVKGYYSPDGTYLGRDYKALSPEMRDAAQWKSHQASVIKETQHSREMGATPGLLQLLQEQASNQRSADINDVAALGPQARAALLASNPDSANLLERLNTQALQGLDSGSNLTPEEARAMQQASRAAFSSRGMTGTNGAIADELLQQFNLGQQLLRQRQQFAGNVLGFNQAVVGDPFQQILGRPATAIGQAQGLYQQAGPSLFNPESAYSGNINNANQQMAALFADPSTMSKVGAVSNTVGSFIGSIAGGMV